MGVGTALAVGAGAVGAFGAYSNMKNQISAARQNAQIIQQQAQMNARFAEMSAAAQAVSVRNRAAFEAQMHEMNAGIMMNNAIAAEQDAQAARERSRFEVDQIDRRNRRIQGAQRAAFGKAGVQIEGTPADVVFDSALQGEIDELAAIYIGNQEVRKNMIEAYNLEFGAEQQRYNADATRFFGDREADYLNWQGRTSAAMMLSNASMQADRIRASIPMIRSQGYINMLTSGIQTGTAAYSMLRSPTPSVSSGTSGSSLTSMGTRARSGATAVVPSRHS